MTLKSAKGLASCALVAAFAVGACSSDESTGTDSTSLHLRRLPQPPSESATAEPEETVEVAAPSEEPQEIEIFDRLLPTEVVGEYFSSLTVEMCSSAPRNRLDRPNTQPSLGVD